MREESLIGREAMERLSRARVILFGIGGVGSYAAEALVRAGVGALTFVDGDTVAESNLNRQLVALRSTIGRNKAEVMKDRALDINPRCRIEAITEYYREENADSINFSEYDYALDAVDSVSSKLLIVCRAKLAGTAVASSMGAGNKLDGTLFCVADIYSTNVCPLARVMRRELKKRGIESLKVVYSEEQPIKPAEMEAEAPVPGKRQTAGSISFVPSAAGLILAGTAIKELAFNE